MLGLKLNHVSKKGHWGYPVWITHCIPCKSPMEKNNANAVTAIHQKLPHLLYFVIMRFPHVRGNGHRWTLIKGLVMQVAKVTNEIMLTYHQKCFVAFTPERAHRNLIGNMCSEITLLKAIWYIPGPISKLAYYKTSTSNGELHRTDHIRYM